MLWLGLHLPRLAIEVFQRSAVSESLQLAVCDRATVLLASATAQSLGVRGGIRRATALAFAPELIIVERDPVREQDALRQIACWALQFTPSVCLNAPAAGPPAAGAARATGSTGSTGSAGSGGSRRAHRPLPRSGLLLEIEPSLHLFGGLDKLLVRIRSGMHELGFSVQMACAPSAHGAWLLATDGGGPSALDAAQLNERLAALPIDCLDSAYPHRETLSSIGARTVRDLLQLPRAGLARRFGKELLAEIDRAQGIVADPRLWFEAPPTFSARMELLADVENAEALLFGARRLLLQLTGWLTAIHGAVRSFELQGLHDDHPPSCLSIRLTDASRDPERLSTLLREKLAVTTLPAPVHSLVLNCDQISLLALPNQELFPTSASAQESLARLVERLQTRLGREQIVRLQLAPDHRPEAAYQLETIDRMEAIGRPQTSRALHSRALQGSRATSDSFVASLPRPLWLLPRAIPISERNNRPYWRGAMNLLAGPERIESGWWDGALIQRDYFVAEDEHNALYWIYRERLGSAEHREGWFIQGRFG